MKKTFKKILKSKVTQGVLCLLVYLYIRLVHLTCRWQVENFYKTDDLASKRAVIFAFWHGRLLMVAPFAPKVPLNIVISNHNDGELITKVMEYFKFGFVRGSSKQDAMSAFKNIIRDLKKGTSIAVTPDGPRGPRMRLGGNIITIAQMASVPIIPVTYSVSKCRILSSWDRFMVAKPFAKGVFIYGDPIYIDRGLSKKELEKAGISLEKQLNNMTRKADEMAGIIPVEPETK